MLIGHSVADAMGILIAVDKSICEIMGRSENELLGISYTELTHPDDRVRNKALMDCLGVRDGPMKLRKRYVRPDGSAVWAEVQASRFQIGPDIGRLVATIQLVALSDGLRDPASMLVSAQRALKLISRRRTELGKELFSDHAFSILLQIYVAEAEGRMVNHEDLEERVGIPSRTLTRWIGALDQAGLVEHLDIPGCVAQLTATGMAKAERLLDLDS